MYQFVPGDKISSVRSESISSSQSDDSSYNSSLASPLPQDDGVAYNAFGRPWRGVQLPVVPLEMLTDHWMAMAVGQAIEIPNLLAAYAAFVPTWGPVPTADGFRHELGISDHGLVYRSTDKVMKLPLVSRGSYDEDRMSPHSGSESSGHSSPWSRSDESNGSISSEPYNHHRVGYFGFPQSIPMVALPVQLAPYESHSYETMALLELERLRRLAAVHKSAQVNSMLPKPPAPPAKATPVIAKPAPSKNESPTQPKFSQSNEAGGPKVSDAKCQLPSNGIQSTISSAYRKYVRTYRCKQCDYIAKSKDDYWYHQRAHIKVHKLLTCPKCLFVTEHKHHLEYHLRNHFGSKPFKCSKCTYSCVNNSMLKSHMKSHTSHCEYRCADCKYATKYCHSLKLHLKKRAHKAANEEVLNGFRKWSDASSSDDCVVVEPKD